MRSRSSCRAASCLSPPAMRIAPSTPPPPINPLLAALTTASTSWSTMSPRMTTISTAASLQAMNEVFQTDRLRAVLWRDDHAEMAFAAYSRPDFVRFLGNPTPHPDLAYTRRWIARIGELQAGRRGGFWAGGAGGRGGG